MLNQNPAYSIINRITNALILNKSYNDSIGLLNGKLGTSILFFQLSRSTKNKLYEEIAYELIDEIYKKLTIETPLNFANGLCGIGWGVQYLIQNRFLEAENEEIFVEFDLKVFQLHKKEIEFERDYEDFYSYGLYYLCRTKNNAWNIKILEFILNDLKRLFCLNIPEETANISFDYLISILYLLNELKENKNIQKNIIEDIVKEIPNFISKYLKKVNIIELQYLKILLHNLDIYSYDIKISVKNDLLNEEMLNIYYQIALYELLFPKMDISNNSYLNHYIKNIDFLKLENLLSKILQKKDRKEFSSIYKVVWLVHALLKNEINYFEKKSNSSVPKTVYIFNQISRGSEYGIGTYIKEISEGLKKKKFNVIVIYLASEKPEFLIEDNGKIQHWYVPIVKNSILEGITDEYFKSAIFILRRYIDKNKTHLFHLNYMNFQFALYLGETFTSKIILVLHFLDWSYLLHGDLKHMRDILNSTKNKNFNSTEKRAIELFEKDKKLFEYVDHIVCLTESARNILLHDYNIKIDKISVVNNGISDKLKSTIHKNKILKLREKYCITSDEKIILYAGRLENIKGVKYLIKALREILKYKLNIRLWIIGDGDYDSLLKEAEGIWNNLCFTGKITQNQLFEIYQIADIGVIPSLFEPFGYVAIEMMMHELPVISTATGGLNEIVIDGITGFKIPLLYNEIQPKVDIKNLVERILYVLNNPSKSKELGIKARKRFIELYTEDKMTEKLILCYEKLIAQD